MQHCREFRRLTAHPDSRPQSVALTAGQGLQIAVAAVRPRAGEWVICAGWLPVMGRNQSGRGQPSRAEVRLRVAKEKPEVKDKDKDKDKDKERKTIPYSDAKRRMRHNWSARLLDLLAWDAAQAGIPVGTWIEMKAAQSVSQAARRALGEVEIPKPEGDDVATDGRDVATNGQGGPLLPNPAQPLPNPDEGAAHSSTLQ